MGSLSPVTPAKENFPEARCTKKPKGPWMQDAFKRKDSYFALGISCLHPPAPSSHGRNQKPGVMGFRRTGPAARVRRVEPWRMGSAALEKSRERRERAHFLSTTAKWRSQLFTTHKRLLTTTRPCRPPNLRSQPPAPWERRVLLLQPTVGPQEFVTAASDGPRPTASVPR